MLIAPSHTHTHTHRFHNRFHDAVLQHPGRGPGLGLLRWAVLDGGMFMSESLPVLSPDTLRSWAALSFSQLVVEVASLFIPTQLIPRDHLEGEKKKSILCFFTLTVTDWRSVRFIIIFYLEFTS